ncbi:uncharacterized protein [Paramisgurnus dabryanus]|uniref:uncharacterized protein isoform X2 n=1 Tax=Paramisgurnus dabryanus TaxID=90735 RepID=UPI0031F37ECC
MMGVVNVVLLVLLVWTFTSVCEEDDNEITINCEDVTARVEDKINLTCTVSYLRKGCSMKSYKFINPEADDVPTICREEFRSDHLSRVSCPYTANKAMTTKFKFFLQTTCGPLSTYFSVNITEITIMCKDMTAHVGDKITLTCTVSYPNQNCCRMMYKFINTEADDVPTICREVFRDPCVEMSRFSCPYTADKAMTTQFKFFVQTTCGAKETYFSVNTTDAVKDDTETV